MPSFRYGELEVPGARSLTWKGDALVDWVGGMASYGLDGSQTVARVTFGYRFDTVIQSQSQEYTILYERLGTKGVIIRGETIIREINRSYYQADIYDYPVAMFRLPDGREAIVHAPNNYNQLEIDLLESGERLTLRGVGGAEPEDVFHSGLSCDPDGQWLMSAGWRWHPYYGVNLYRIADALLDGSILDGPAGAVAHCAEIAVAGFLVGARAILASQPDADCFSDDEDSDVQLRPGTIGVFDPASGQWLSRIPFNEPTGRLFAVDADHVLSLFNHPKLIDLRSGQIVERWPQISSGTWNGCISSNTDEPDAMAWDPLRKRLTVASSTMIQILAFAGPAT